MKNITFSMDEDLIKLGREYAKRHNISLDVLVCRLIEQTVKGDNTSRLDDTFDYIDENIDSSNGVTWTREDLYRC